MLCVANEAFGEQAFRFHWMRTTHWKIVGFAISATQSLFVYKSSAEYTMWNATASAVRREKHVIIFFDEVALEGREGMLLLLAVVVVVVVVVAEKARDAMINAVY